MIFGSETTGTWSVVREILNKMSKKFRRNLYPAKPEPKTFVHYSPVIPLISGNPVTSTPLLLTIMLRVSSPQQMKNVPA
uniref:Uncharacterized protein n=1 Tax=Candidatus Kentrum sp. UNK TaxID=2126344 RepID=A0A451ASB2_9GAMM|nr:MAG: hypothetical protein BECKUNK1418H_GA0071006_100827 [Candidatus Kentron sp. UNK]